MTDTRNDRVLFKWQTRTDSSRGRVRFYGETKYGMPVEADPFMELFRLALRLNKLHERVVG